VISTAAVREEGTTLSYVPVTFPADAESSALFIVSHLKKKPAGEVLAVRGKTYEDKPIEKKVGIDEAIATAIEAVRILDIKL